MIKKPLKLRRDTSVVYVITISVALESLFHVNCLFCILETKRLLQKLKEFKKINIILIKLVAQPTNSFN